MPRWSSRPRRRPARWKSRRGVCPQRWRCSGREAVAVPQGSPLRLPGGVARLSLRRKWKRRVSSLQLERNDDVGVAASCISGLRSSVFGTTAPRTPSDSYRMAE
ncbi:hypothetical protein BN2475_70092 [Paraburkholderia ribeironis]|uniref:Uncharacterized protein n=1 Tax=Paraburkholderia ribeironis TaxID=1247936 RepID=A0A1N7RLY4_9BURK|nr:hypothetical protein BN2475_70092 [Paraburkholderia ribeironis]